MHRQVRSVILGIFVAALLGCASDEADPSGQVCRTDHHGHFPACRAGSACSDAGGGP